MITNKDLSIDRENGKITLNGNKYDLGTQGEIDTAVKDVYSVMGQNGAKNLIPYPYYESDHTDSGITWTVNSDGSVTANGTATANSTFIFRQRTEQTKFLEKNTSYIFSGCPSGGSSSTYAMIFFVKNEDDSNVVSGAEYGDGRKIDMPNQDYYGIYAFARVFSGQTVSNLTFKPMLRLASDTDNKYEPYAMTNKQLTETIGDITQTGISGASVAAQLGSVHSLISMTNDLPPVATTTPADIPTGIRIHFNIGSQTAGYPLGNALYVSIKIAESRCVQILFENGAATPEGKYRTVLNSTTWSDWKAF